MTEVPTVVLSLPGRMDASKLHLEFIYLSMIVLYKYTGTQLMIPTRQIEYYASYLQSAFLMKELMNDFSYSGRFQGIDIIDFF